MDGEPGLTLTGQLGDVMKESAQIALSLRAVARGRARRRPGARRGGGSTCTCPAGAVPKDGPSAGVTMTTALVSLLTGRPVRADVGMTGEVTLQGRVLPIGGVKQKVLAAQRAGLTTVILPAAQRPRPRRRARGGAGADDVPPRRRRGRRPGPRPRGPGTSHRGLTTARGRSEASARGTGSRDFRSGVAVSNDDLDPCSAAASVVPAYRSAVRCGSSFLARSGRLFRPQRAETCGDLGNAHRSARPRHRRGRTQAEGRLYVGRLLSSARISASAGWSWFRASISIATCSAMALADSFPLLAKWRRTAGEARARTLIRQSGPARPFPSTGS